LPFGSLLEIEILKCKVNTISRSLATYVAVKPADSVHYLLGTKLYIPSTRSAHAAVIKFEQFYISDWLSVLADIIIDYQLLYYVYSTYSIQACTIFVHTHTHTHTHTHVPHPHINPVFNQGLHWLLWATRCACSPSVLLHQLPTPPAASALPASPATAPQGCVIYVELNTMECGCHVSRETHAIYAPGAKT